MAKYYLYQARDSVTGEMHYWTTTSASGSTGYPGPNTAQERVLVATHGSDGGGDPGPISVAASDVENDSDAPGETLDLTLNDHETRILALEEAPGGGGSSPPFDDDGPIVFQNGDPTATVRLVASAVPTETERLIIAANSDVDLEHVTPFGPGQFCSMDSVWPMTGSSEEIVNGWLYHDLGGSHSRSVDSGILYHNLNASGNGQGASISMDYDSSMPPDGTVLVARVKITSNVNSNGLFCIFGFFDQDLGSFGSPYAGITLTTTSAFGPRWHINTEAEGGDLITVASATPTASIYVIHVWRVGLTVFGQVFQADGITPASDVVSVTLPSPSSANRVGVCAYRNSNPITTLLQVQYMRLRIGNPLWTGRRTMWLS